MCHVDLHDFTSDCSVSVTKPQGKRPILWSVRQASHLSVGPPGMSLPFPPDPFSKFALDADSLCQPIAHGCHKCVIYVGPLVGCS